MKPKRKNYPKNSKMGTGIKIQGDIYVNGVRVMKAHGESLEELTILLKTKYS